MIKVVFLGTPDIGLNTLNHLHNSDKFDVLAVVTQPDKPAGRDGKICKSVFRSGYPLERSPRYMSG